jgi:F-type H+-transporting ATPase subunit delta
MTELATLARPYAEALFQVVESSRESRAQDWSTWLHEFARVASLPEVRSIANHPKVARRQIVELLFSTVKSPVQSLDEQAMRNFVQLLVEHRRLEVLPEIAAQFDALKNAREGAADAIIVSAFALSGAQLDELVAKLEHKFKRKLKPHVTVDASLIGGVCITVGDQVLDASVRAQLARLQTTLTA